MKFKNKSVLTKTRALEYVLVAVAFCVLFTMIVMLIRENRLVKKQNGELLQLIQHLEVQASLVDY